MRISRLIAAAVLSLVIAGASVPASAVPADKGASSRDCGRADVRVLRLDRTLCTQQPSRGQRVSRANIPRGQPVKGSTFGGSPLSLWREW